MNYLTQRGTRVPVAVKTLKQGSGEEAQQDFLSEIRIMEHLAMHPNLVSMVGKCTIDAPLMLVLELASGGSFEDWLQLHPRASVDQHAYILWQVTCGLTALHGHGIVHRDIALRNVLILDNLTAKVSMLYSRLLNLL